MYRGYAAECIHIHANMNVMIFCFSLLSIEKILLVVVYSGVLESLPCVVELYISNQRVLSKFK